MLQRIQTIFILGSMACMILLLFNPIWIKTSIETHEQVTLTAFELKQQTLGSIETFTSSSTIYIAIAVILSILVSQFSIIQYRKRVLQIRLASVNSLLMAISIALIYYFKMQGNTLLDTGEGHVKFAYFLPAVAFIFNYLAKIFIKKDEKLVRSVDRLR